MLEAALFTRKLASNFFSFLTFVLHFMLDPVPEPECISVPVPIPLKQKVAVPVPLHW